MAKPLNPEELAAVRKAGSRAERREQKRKQMHEEIVQNQGGSGVIIIPPQKATGTFRRNPQTARGRILPGQYAGRAAGRQL